MKFRIVSLMLLAMLLFGSVAVFPVVALPANSMWIEPLEVPEVDPYVGLKFNVTVWFNVTTGANSWQFYLTYNKNHLQALRADYTGAGKSLWSGPDAADAVAPSFGDHDATRGYVLHGEVLKQSKERTGSGSLSWVEFEIIAAPGEGETLESLLRLDTSGIFDSFAMTAGYDDIPLTLGSSTYIYALPWTPPPPATISVDPEFTMDRSLAPCSNFTINITISDATNVSSFEVKLVFNNTVLNVLEANIGDFVPHTTTPTIDINNTIGQLTISAALDPSETPMNGNGVLATIEFHVESNGSSWLGLTDLRLRDYMSRPLPFNTVDGYFNNVAILGDLDNDGKVDIQDVAVVSAAFGSHDAHERWDERTDLNGDGMTNIHDVALVCQHFGKFN